MGSNFQKRSASFIPGRPLKDELPISHSQSSTESRCLVRKRLTSLSDKIRPLSTSAASAVASSFPRSKSVSSMGGLAGGLLRRWWDWVVGWIMSRKPSFARDLEMNEVESAMLGSHCKGSLRHVLYKVRSELRRLVNGGGKVG